MDITITGRNIDLDGSLKEYIHRRLDKLERLYRRIYKCEVILEEEKVRKNVEIRLYLKRNRIVAKESSPDIYASIDSAAEKIKKQARRLSGRISSRRRKAMFSRFVAPMTRMRSRGRSLYDECVNGEIYSSDAFADKPMMPEEAKLELDMSGKVFLVFKNAETGEVNVMYRRNDDNYGMIEPKF